MPNSAHAMIKVTPIKSDLNFEGEFPLIVARRTELRIQALIECGKLPDNWHQVCTEFADVLCERADVMLYPSKKTLAEAARILDGLVEALAILAFVKGGVELFGYRFEASFDGCSKA